MKILEGGREGGREGSFSGRFLSLVYLVLVSCCSGNNKNQSHISPSIFLCWCVCVVLEESGEKRKGERGRAGVIVLLLREMR